MNSKLFLASLLPVTLPAALSAEKASTHPNIVIFLVDDMGWEDTSVPFYKEVTTLNRKYHTPNMERLASEGVKFTQAYACTVSTPSRVSLLTGMEASRHKVTNWTLKKNAAPDANDNIIQPPKWNVNGLCETPGIERTVLATTLPDLLRKNGYATIMCGKAHFGAMDTPGSNPLNLGFDINIAGHAAGGPGSYLGEANYGNKFHEWTQPWGVPGLEKYHGTNTFLTEALTREALHAVDSVSRTKKPFFLYMAHYAVHIPYSPDKRFYQKYIDKGLDKTEAMYAALLEGMDKSLGDIMDYLDKHHLSDNTIILFMSDNGGLSFSARGGRPNTHNLPLSSGKGSAYEGGIREPMIVKWPGITKANSTITKYVKIEDFFPSILDMADIRKYKTKQHVDGINFVPLLKGDSLNADKRCLYWHYPNNWISGNGTELRAAGIGAYSAIRQGDYKLIYFHKDRTLELYNIAKDIGEKNNLAAKYPAKTKELAIKLSNYLRKSKAQMPTDKTTGKLVEMPDEVLKKQKIINVNSR